MRLAKMALTACGLAVAVVSSGEAQAFGIRRPACTTSRPVYTSQPVYGSACVPTVCSTGGVVLKTYGSTVTDPVVIGGPFAVAVPVVDDVTRQAIGRLEDQMRRAGQNVAGVQGRDLSDAMKKLKDDIELIKDKLGIPKDKEQ